MEDTPVTGVVLLSRMRCQSASNSYQGTASKSFQLIRPISPVSCGFGLQRIAGNFISGFIVLFDRSIRPGDVITIDDTFGWVQEMHARHVVVRDRAGVERLIPNETLITTEVINWSYSDRNVRIKIPVSISYDNDPEQAMAILLEAAKANPA
jgi:small-conductance mechanosensitive channel